MSAINPAFSGKTVLSLNEDPYSIYVPEPSTTDMQIKKVAAIIFSAVLLTGGIAIVSMAASGTIAWPVSLVAIPLIALGAGIIYSALQWKDYDDPFDRSMMKEKAVLSTFSELLKEHGLDNIRKYQLVSLADLQAKFINEYEFLPFSKLIEKFPLETIRKHHLMPLETLKKKFARELQTLDLSAFLQRFSIYDLHTYQILEGKEFFMLQDLSSLFKKQKEETNLAEKKLDTKYLGRQERLLSELQAEERDVRREMLFDEARSQSSDLALRSYYLGSIEARQYQLDGIGRRRKAIVEQRIGETLQHTYQRELDQVLLNHKKALDALSQEFKKFKLTL